jgi:hypothetical protein
MNVRKSLTLSTREYYMTHLLIINTIIPPILRITHKEIEVLAAFLTVPPDVRFTSLGRKLVRDALSLSPSSISNYMKALITKKFILTSPQDESIPIGVAPNILPNPTQEYHIRIIHDPSLPEPPPQTYEETNHNLNIIYNGQDQSEETIQQEDHQHIPY